MSPPNISLLPSRNYSDLPPFERADVLGVTVGIFTRHRVTSLLRECLDSGVRGWISYINVNTLNIAYDQPWFRLFLNNSLFTYCDGQGVRLGAAILGKSLPERIVMSDWIYDVCEASVARGLRLYLLGSTKDSLAQAIINLKQLYPDIQIVGSHHGYFSELEGELVTQSIARLNVDILIVGMGMPLQEEWILRYYDRLNARVILNAGSCFDYVSGFKKRCPVWMGIMGLEWVYRLAQEPGRLWKRYLLGNPLFLFRIIASRLERK
ncbi:MAG: WecB/TagA/CpsF family glycosyltransferase [Bacteroidota bacterium]